MDNENFNVEFGEVVNIGGGTSDFNQLSNRPKYNNTTMTGATNIPKVPAKTSELNNDSDYQTGTEVSSAIDTAVSGLDIPTKTSDLTNDGSDGTSTYVESDDLATVATSGSYNDLSNTPTIPEAQVQSDWSQTDNTKVDFIKNKPTIPSAQVNADWNASSGVAEILNKPTIPTVNDATLTITQNGTAKGTFTANDADDTTIEVKDTTYTAGSNVAISDQNVISATDTTYSNFTGTDGTAAGTAGLVPAPATTDAGKFLKADGTWDTAGGGGSDFKVLSSADYNYPANNPTAVALWLLPPGVYIQPSPALNVYANNESIISSYTAGTFIVGNTKEGNVKILAYGAASDSPAMLYSTSVADGSKNYVRHLIDETRIVDTLKSTSTELVLPVKTGKTLNDKIEGRLITNAGAPTTATVGTVGQLLEDTTNGKLYICTDTTGGSYTWTEVGAGGGGSGITELTSADYNWPTDNPVGVALWLLDNGTYYVADSSVGVYVTNAKIASQGIYMVADYGTASKQVIVNDLADEIYGVYRMDKTTGAQGAYHPYAPTVVQTTGTSTTDVMSQNAVTSMVFADPATMEKIKIGAGTSSSEGSNGIEIGHNAGANGSGALAIGYGAVSASGGSISIGTSAGGSNGSAVRSIEIGHSSRCIGNGAVALGAGAFARNTGEMNIGSSDTSYGYNSTNYRLLTGLYDGQSAHDAATVAQGNTLATSAPTTSTVGVLGQLYTDTTNMHTYQCTAISGDTYTWTQRW